MFSSGEVFRRCVDLYPKPLEPIFFIEKSNIII